MRSLVLKQDVRFQSAVAQGTLLIFCCMNLVSVRPEIQKCSTKTLTLRSIGKMLREQTLLSLWRLEEKDFLSLGLLNVGLVASHCTIFMHEHKTSKSKRVRAVILSYPYCFHPMILIHLVRGPSCL